MTAEQCFLFEDWLPTRLRELGLAEVDRVLTHTNSTVMLSLSRRTLRLHRGYAFAPDDVLRAIVQFLNPRVPRVRRRAAEREFLRFPVASYVALPHRARRHERPRTEDRIPLQRLKDAHRALNLLHFGGTLGELPIRLSGRMKSRLGELVVNQDGKPKEIGMSRRHIRRHDWCEVEHTLLHEMVHQWQAETGLEVDHGPTFRAKAREVGVLAAAKRKVPVPISGGNA
ncbi:MAG TPA: SprT-like domain-containing protein [Gemmatimonadales bacterium]